MYDNAPNETRYIYTDFDTESRRLSGANRYTVTFAAGQTPPVDGFWSLTVYNKEHFFEPNELKRFSLGTKSKSMKQDADGSTDALLPEHIARSGQGNKLGADPG
jgi:hypothetical protein